MLFLVNMYEKFNLHNLFLHYFWCLRMYNTLAELYCWLIQCLWYKIFLTYVVLINYGHDWWLNYQKVWWSNSWGDWRFLNCLELIHGGFFGKIMLYSFYSSLLILVSMYGKINLHDLFLSYFWCWRIRKQNWYWQNFIIALLNVCSMRYS